MNICTNLSQFILQLIVFLYIEFLLAGSLIKVIQEVSVLSLWIHIVLKEIES